MDQDYQQGSLRILIVEDNQDHQHLLLLALINQRPNADVRVVSSGSEFLSCIQRESFDCVVVDFNLPDFRANELVHEAAEHLKTTPVVIVSTSKEQSTVIDCFRSGVVDFVPKDQAMNSDALWRSAEHAIGDSKRRCEERREQDRRERHLANLAETDQLTGLNNRRYFERCLEEERWVNDRRKHMSIALIDIDHFKQINDTFGHNAGDETLRQIADFLLTQVSGSDIVIRWGGEEILVLRRSVSLAECMEWAERLRDRIAHRTVQWEDQAINISVSIGLHQVPVDELNLDAIDKVDRAMYLAKCWGRNRVCTWPMAEIDHRLNDLAKRKDLSPEQRFEQILSDILPRLGSTQREHLTSHAEQVSEMARQIARVLQLNSQTEQQVALAGRMHDIGKCMIPESLLAKPTRYSLMERAIVAQHAEYGANIAKRLGFDETIVRMIREHHQRFDGTCNRADLSELHTGSRVLCVTDALVTMMTHRSYQPARSLIDALQELRREKGHQFDPDVVEAAHFIESLFRLAA